jgi:MATE family multidrug resistance protein
MGTGHRQRSSMMTKTNDAKHLLRAIIHLCSSFSLFFALTNIDSSSHYYYLSQFFFNKAEKEVDKEERGLLSLSLTDDDTVYDDYTANTIDTGWMLFIIAVSISIASVVILPLNVKLGRYCFGDNKQSQNDDDDNAAGGESSFSTLQKTWKLIVSIIRYDNETHRLLRLAIPFTCYCVVITIAALILLGFISQYLGTDSMVAYTIVNLTVGTTSQFLKGFIEAVSSLGSMAFGTENYFFVGQYVQAAILLYLLCQTPFIFIWGRFMKEIILLFGFDESAADIASNFVWVALPLEIIKGIDECFYNFLSVIEYEAFATILACITAVVEVALVWLMLYLYKADLVNVGLLMVLTRVFFLLLTLLVCKWFGWFQPYEDGMIRSLALKNRLLMQEFLKTSFPLAVGCLLAYAEWEVLTIFAAVLGPAEAATWAVLGFVWDLFESTTEAFGDAGEVRVSYQLGKGRPQLAKLASYKIMFMGFVMALIMSTIFLSLINVLPAFLTTDQTIQDMLRMVFPLMALGNVTMSVGMVCWALVGAQLRYPLATTINTLCSFGITLPLGAVFTIALNYDLKGLTFSVVVGYIICAMLMSTVLLMSDWENLSEKIRAKMLEEGIEESSSDDDDSSSSSSSISSRLEEYHDAQDGLDDDGCLPPCNPPSSHQETNMNGPARVM